MSLHFIHYAPSKLCLVLTWGCRHHLFFQWWRGNILWWELRRHRGGGRGTNRFCIWSNRGKWRTSPGRRDSTAHWRTARTYGGAALIYRVVVASDDCWRTRNFCMIKQIKRKNRFFLETINSNSKNYLTITACCRTNFFVKDDNFYHTVVLPIYFYGLRF